MNDGIVTGECFGQTGLVLDIAADEDGARGHQVAAAGGEVVEYCNLMAGVEENTGRVTANKAGAPGYEYPHAEERLQKTEDRGQRTGDRRSLSLRHGARPTQGSCEVTGFSPMTARPDCG